MGVVFTETFEDGTWSKWATVYTNGGASVGISAAGARHDALGARVLTPSGAYDLRTPALPAEPAGGWHTRFYTLWVPNPAVSVGAIDPLAKMCNSGNILNYGVFARKYADPDAWEIAIRYKTTASVTVDYPALGDGWHCAPNAWYAIEMHGRTGPSGFVHVSVNDVPVLSLNAGIMTPMHHLNLNRVGANHLENRFDSFAVSDEPVGLLRAFRVYDNSGAGPVNYASARAVLVDWATEWTSEALAVPATWRFGVRAVNEFGEERNVNVTKEFSLLDSGAESPARPNRPTGLAARPEADGCVEVSWSYDDTDEPEACTHFHVCSDAGTGAIDYATPVGSVAKDDSGPLTHYALLTGALADGVPHRFAVRAAGATDVEDDGIESVACTPDASPPATPATLSAAVVL